MEENLEVLRQQGRDISRGMLKGLEKRKQTLEAKLQNIQDSIAERKDDAVDFKMMGIDHLFVDESHQFKNLMFNTRHDRVSGLGNPDGSQRALNMLFAIRTIQERSGKDLGATFLSGTTISNSLTELYLLFKYLRPQALESRASTVLMLGQPSLPRSRPTMSSPSQTTSFRRNGSEHLSRCQSWLPFMRKYGSRKQNMA